MKVSEAKLTALFVACGVDTATDWGKTPGKLRAKLDGGMKKYLEEGGPTPAGELAVLFDELVAAQADGTEIEITPGGDDVYSEEPINRASPKPAKKGTVRTPAAAKPKSKDKLPAKKKTKPRAAKVVGGKKVPAPKKKLMVAVPTTISVNGHVRGSGEYYRTKFPKPIPISNPDGVIGFIVSRLSEAGSAGKPITREDLHKKMVGKFKERDPDKMWTTLCNQVPSRLKLVRGITVQGDKDGYYIGNTEVPKAVKKETPKKKPKKKVKA